MAGYRFERALVLLLAGSLFACAGVDTRPDDMSAAEHRAQAIQTRREAAQEEQIARSEPRPTLGYGPDHGSMADALRDHAREHEAASRELLNFQAQECAGLAVDFRGQCPLVQVEYVEETKDGVILVLRSGTDVEKSLHLIQCYLAYGRAQGFEGDPGCPFYVRGVHVIPVEGRAALRLAASDDAALARLERLIRRAFGPATAPTSGAGGPRPPDHP